MTINQDRVDLSHVGDGERGGSGISLPEFSTSTGPISNLDIRASEQSPKWITANPAGLVGVIIAPIGSGLTQTRIDQLEARVAELEREVEELRGNLPDEEVIVLRTVTREQAKEEIRGIFASGETLYYSDIAERLSIDLELVVEICEELETEGDIEVDANAV